MGRWVFPANGLAERRQGTSAGRERRRGIGSHQLPEIPKPAWGEGLWDGCGALDRQPRMFRKRASYGTGIRRLLSINLIRTDVLTD